MKNQWKSVLLSIGGILLLMGFFLWGLKSSVSPQKTGKVQPRKPVVVDVESPTEAGALTGPQR